MRYLDADLNFDLKFGEFYRRMFHNLNYGYLNDGSVVFGKCEVNTGLKLGGECMQELIVTTNYKLKIKRVIYNDPATIILWRDGTKTVVKCDKDDKYDPEKGFLLCVLKRLLGNKGNYNKELKKWTFEGATKEDE